MSKNIKLVILIVVLASFGTFVFYSFSHNKKIIPKEQEANTAPRIIPPLSTKYITAQGWPPKVEVISGPFSCDESGSEIAKTTKKVIAGKTYCVTVQSEGAAGSIYNTYTYVTVVGAQVTKTTFILRFVQCDNYEDPQKTECKNERAAFDPDIFI